jgi:uncharacterized protein
MIKTYQGRVILSGSCKGVALVSRKGFNTLASFQKSIILRQKTALCSDQDNQDLFNQVMTSKILCLPQTIGSTTGGLAIQTIASMGIGPAAFLFSEHIDSLAAAGVVLSDVWLQQRIITIDQLGADFLAQTRSGQVITIFEDGKVEVEDLS